MGRLRNLSASFKAAAFPTSSANGYSRNTPNSTDRLAVDSSKETPAIVREASSTSVLGSSSSARPTSAVYSAPTLMPAGVEEIEELKPVFSFLSSHANKLYQEGYFLKLDDLDTSGKPNSSRVWTECFAQLVGTILSFWDAEALDAAGQDGEVAPSFINLADASIKMIETLPTRNQEVQPLQNVLSVSTAGKNRYLFHFNSLHSLTQWTAGIRLAMFENASLQELYTGSLIAGKGRHLNSINQIMTKSKFKIEDWARVRFGAGTPWRRCWCVIEPPDEKEWQRSQKRIGKRSAYEKVAFPKGDIKFYDTKKTKKVKPIATITDAYSAYAIYPQSKTLVNESTLVKLEGKITIHSQPESKTEGFVFVMPEVHPAVSGFEMMLRWLLPVYDTFTLYGRPTRLIPNTRDPKSLMFAMPKERRYGYLDIIDISALIHTDGSNQWTEREWRKQMKEAVSRRMAMQAQGRTSNVERIRDAPRSAADIRSDGIASSSHQNISTDAVFNGPQKTMTSHIMSNARHARSASENIDSSPTRPRDRGRTYTPTRLSEEGSPSPTEAVDLIGNQVRQPLRPRINEAGYQMDSANSSDSEVHNPAYAEDVKGVMVQQKPVQPVVAPPEFQHLANEQPKRKPADRPEMRREQSRFSSATLSQMNPRALEALRREEAAQAQNGQHFQGSSGRSSPAPAAASAAAAAAAAWSTNNNSGRGYAQHSHQNRGVTAPELDYSHGILANSQRPVVVNTPSSTSIPKSIKRKPVAATDSIDTKHLFIPSTSISTQQTSEPPNPMIPFNMQTRDSSPEPDYASHASEDQPAPKERIRGGVRKVIGDPGSEKNPKDDLDIHIDFGQTLRLNPDTTPENTSRPSTAGGRRSPFDALGRPVSSSGRRSPFDTLTPGTGRKSPLNPFESPARTPEKQSPTTDRPAHSRSHSYAWQPGFQLNESKDGLTPEEFVQHRAALASRPQGYVQHRTLSSGRVDHLRTESTSRPTSPVSPRKLQKPRPSSRQSSGQSIDYSSHLSAREQEHVARVTGGPLLGNVVNNTRNPDPNVGLIGAIEAREQERKNIKDGLQGRMVQAAIDQRHREARSSAILQAQTDQRRQSQYMAQAAAQQQQQQQQQQYLDPNMYHYAATEYAPQSQAGWPVPHQPPQQDARLYQQSMYGMQSAQSQMGYTTAPSYAGQGRPGAPSHARTQSGYSQYAGYYTPQSK